MIEIEEVDLKILAIKKDKKICKIKRKYLTLSLTFLESVKLGSNNAESWTVLFVQLSNVHL